MGSMNTTHNNHDNDSNNNDGRDRRSVGNAAFFDCNIHTNI